MKSNIILSGRIPAELGYKCKGFKSLLHALCREELALNGLSERWMFLRPG